MEEEVDNIQLTSKQAADVTQAMAAFKRELRTASKNELVRMCAQFYARLTIATFQNEALYEQLQKKLKGSKND